MLGGRFTPANLERYLESTDRRMFVLRRSGQAIGYCSYARTDEPNELKLEQLYLLPALHGQGLGRLMLEHVETDALRPGCEVLMLQVNKQNAVAIDVYRRAGFTVRKEVVVDIGNGFVMDDFIMEKRLR